MKKIAFISGVLFALPLVSFAQNAALNPLIQIVQTIQIIVNLLIPILLAAAVVAFFFGLVRYIWGGSENTAEGRRIMIQGLIAIFVMVTLWGLIKLGQDILGIQQGQGDLQAPHVR